ncbi:hypothetical protein HID58_080295, partial [Brassica napus]
DYNDLSKNPKSSRLALVSKSRSVDPLLWGLDSLYIVFLRRALVGWSRLNSSIFGNMEGSPYRKFSISRRKGGDSGTGPGKLHSREPEFLLAGILGTGVPSSGDPEAGVLPGVWRNSTPEYFSQQFAPYCSISSSNSGNNLCTQVNWSCSFSSLLVRVYEKGIGYDETLEFAPSRGVLLVARGNLPRRLSNFPILSLWSSFTQAQFSIFRMKPKSDLALDSSSIGGRIRSGASPSESMDSSGSSLDLTVEVENLSREVVDLAPSSAEVGEFPPVGPLSSIGVDEVANWRA